MRARVASLLVAAIAVAADATLSASYRKDAYLPYSTYPEAGLPDPSSGGRIHIVGLATSSGAVGDVYVNGAFVNMSTGQNPADWPIDWLRVEPVALVGGQPVWVSFHSRQAEWDGLSTATVTVMTAEGDVALNGTFPVTVPRVRVTWATTDSDRSRLLVWLHNNDNATEHVATAALVNGVDVLSLLTPAARRVPAGGSTLWTLPASAVAPGGAATLPAGAVWTVEAWWDNATAASAPSLGLLSAAGGNLFREFFPMETWQKSSDCPFPTVNDTNYAAHRSHGIDTFFVTSGSASDCNGPTGEEIVGQLAPQYGFYALAGTDIRYEKLDNTSALVGWFLADEDDTKIDDGLRQLLATVQGYRSANPDLPTYAGGSRNRYTGIFAGSCDIKGMDFYIAGCAPHVTNWGFAPPPRGSYDYLRNTVANHAPLGTWLYTQAFDSGWDALNGLINRQPDAAEIAVQVASVVLAGAKGFMAFQTELKYYDGTAATEGTHEAWATFGTLAREIGAMRELYRAGDVTGMAAALSSEGNADADVLTDAIVGPRAIVVPLINTKNSGGYSDVGCGIQLAQHWAFDAHSVDVLQVRTPYGFQLVDSFEVFNGTVLPGQLIPVNTTDTGAGAASAASAAAAAQLDEGAFGRVLSLTNVQMGNQGAAQASGPESSITRTFVFAADANLRGEIAAALAAASHWQAQHQAVTHGAVTY